LPFKIIKWVTSIRGGPKMAGSPGHHNFRDIKILFFCPYIYIYIKGEFILFKLCKVFTNKVIGTQQKSKLINAYD